MPDRYSPLWQRSLREMQAGMQAAVVGALKAAVGVRSVIKECSADAGGGIKVFGSNLTISSTSFDECMSSDLNGGTALYAIRSSVYAEDITLMESTCQAGPSTIYAESGPFLLTGAAFKCADTQMQPPSDVEGEAQSSSSSIRLLTLPGAVITNTSFDSERTSNSSSAVAQYDISVNDASVQNVYVEDASALALSPSDESLWAVCWPLTVVRTKNGSFSSCSSLLSRLSSVSVVNCARGYEVPVLGVVSPAGSDPGNCEVDSAAVGVTLMGQGRGYRMQSSNCSAQPVPPPIAGIYNVSVIIAVTIVVFIVIFLIVFLIFFATKSAYILDNTDYKSNIPLLREEEKIKKSEEDLAGRVIKRAQDAGNHLVSGVSRCVQRARTAVKSNPTKDGDAAQ